MAESTTTRPAMATLEAVAAEAGVSRSTVSRVVNGGNHVRPEVAATVTAAIERLNYSPNRAARSLAKSTTMAIGLVVPEDTTKFFGDPFFAEIVHGITHELEPSDYVLNLQLSSPNTPSAKTRNYLSGGNVDGAIVVSHHSGDEFLLGLNSIMPVILGGRPYPPADETIAYVDVDNRGGAVVAAEHLVSLGRRRIAMIGGPRNMRAAMDRLTGFVSVMESRGLPSDLIATGDYTISSGAAAMRELFARDPAIDAVFAANDLMARGAIDVLTEHGRQIPQDVAIVGYDDSMAATNGALGLTTIRQPSREMGAAMARTLLGMLREEPVQRQLLMPTQLVVRDTA